MWLAYLTGNHQGVRWGPVRKGGLYGAYLDMKGVDDFLKIFGWQERFDFGNGAKLNNPK